MANSVKVALQIYVKLSELETSLKLSFGKTEFVILRRENMFEVVRELRSLWNIILVEWSVFPTPQIILVLF
jgi:hypothetical protein